METVDQFGRLDSIYWQSRWENGQTGWHLEGPNPLLVKYFSHLPIASGSKILVPLCGATYDIDWLLSLGHRVTGIEVSPKALESLKGRLPMNPLDPEEFSNPLPAFGGGNLTFFLGDLFKSHFSEADGFDLIYDRAAFIALSPCDRFNYLNKISFWLKPKGYWVLLNMEYPQTEMEGPPFNLPEEEIRTLLGADWSVQCIYSEDGLALSPKFKERGLSSLREKILVISRKENRD